MAENVTTMNLMVDLQCDKCRKTVTKVLRKFPREIRDPIYDEKQNIVTITVVSCNPEKIMEKLCRKGCGCIKSIEIVDTMNKKEPDKKREQQKPSPEERLESEPESPKENPPESEPESLEENPPPPVRVPTGVCCVPCYEGRPGGPCFQGYGGPPPPAPTVSAPASLPPARVPTRICCVPCSEGRPGGRCFQGYGGPPPCYCGCYCGKLESPQQKPRSPAPTVSAPASPSPARVPTRICCVPCSEGRPGGPCFEGYGGPPPCYCGCYCGRPVYDSYGGGTPCYVSRCDQYFSDENPLGCTIM